MITNYKQTPRHIILADTYPPMCDAWDEIAKDFDHVTVHRGSILDLECDAIVSPANSFGFMDGGIDAAYTGFFGLQLQEELRRRIKERYENCELLVGEALAVPTGHPKIRWMIAAPTMRIPEKLPANTVNPFLAARAALLRAEEMGLGTLAIPGLGTLTGQVTPTNCARQVAEAIRWCEDQQMLESWREVSVQLKRLIWGKE